MNEPGLPSGFTHPLKIGGGAFGLVYRARQATLDRWVALKIIYEKAAARRRQLLKEATTQADIHINCIPQVYDAFEWKHSICIVMQWIKGINLSQLLARSPSQQERMWLATGFIRALASLHSKGYAHRDIKPANIIISPSDGVFLVDFSFTKKVSDMHKSMSGVVKGTPAYMAPELWRGNGDVDYMRADLYSAGVILKEILGASEAAPVTGLLLCEEPAKRLADGEELLKKWQERYGDAFASAQWEQFVGQIASQLHARNLLTAAQNLLMKNRHDEAYWLLVECLEEDPDYGAALELMNRFPALARSRAFRRNTAVALAACAVVAAVALAVFVGRHNRASFNATIANLHATESHETMLFKSARQAQPARQHQGRFVHDSLSFQRLAGRIFLKKYPAEGELRINGKPCAAMNLELGIPLPFGTHVLAWNSDTKGIVWRERVFILPFQVKGLTINLK
jgi:hypothetical protein